MQPKVDPVMGKVPLLIVGNAEIASLAFEYFSHDSEYEPVGFTIGAEYIKEPSHEGLPVLPLEDAFREFPATEVKAFVAVGDWQLNRVRARLYRQMEAQGYDLVSYISSRAFVWHNVTIGKNCFILEDNTVQPFVTIGNNVTLWSGNHIGHRSVIEDHCFISSHVVVSGFCRIGEYTFMGVNTATAHGVNVAKDNYISMSASLNASTQEDRIYVGNPAEEKKVAATRFCRVRGE